MVVVGFDVGKDSLFAARLDRGGVVKEHWELDNTPVALLPLLRGLRRKYKHLLVASEATAEYHRPLAQLCLALNIPFSLINPHCYQAVYACHRTQEENRQDRR